MPQESCCRTPTTTHRTHLQNGRSRRRQLTDLLNFLGTGAAEAISGPGTSYAEQVIRDRLPATATATAPTGKLVSS
jgi:hypothetical protein